MYLFSVFYFEIYAVVVVICVNQIPFPTKFPSISEMIFHLFFTPSFTPNSASVMQKFSLICQPNPIVNQSPFFKKLILSLLKVVLTRTVLGSGNTGRYEGNTSRGFLLNLDFLLVPPMSDDHHDHHPDHDDDQAGRGDEHGQERL